MVWMLTKNKPPIQQITLEYNDDKHNQILKQWPFMAALIDYQSGDLFCSGIMIGNDIVMTAAQCLEHTKSDGTKIRRKMKEFRIFINCNNIHHGGCQSHELDLIGIHNDYNDLIFKNDLALIKYKNKQQSPKNQPDNKQSNNISLYPQFLPKNEYNQVFERLDLTQCSIVGYGYPTKEQLKNLDKKLKNEILQKPYGSLHSIHIPVMNELSIIDNNDICLRYYNDEYRPKETFCIGPEQSSLLAIFNGDHGSPLICSSLDGGYRVLGLITNQLKMNQNNHQFSPILFTNISYHQKWIITTIEFLKALENPKHTEKWLFYREKHRKKSDKNVEIRDSHYSASSFWMLLPVLVSIVFMVAGIYYYYNHNNEIPNNISNMDQIEQNDSDEDE
ncbi:hypothetical protein DERP_006558 [Dermatophagoides pteronyssinus]|uniref:Peptidase S1 domain-containing protein n=1 Tax=Dermatophagoides pteronyssinus TaxID=6956 RepID=A0ABQ8IQJ2_DERPT|nr:hypothetical protein DERP_006558 [Dermatophagoides pteronyssinus]